jgi:hypothetical protein
VDVEVGVAVTTIGDGVGVAVTTIGVELGAGVAVDADVGELVAWAGVVGALVA